MEHIIDKLSGLEVSFALERPRLVGLCARITGSADAAEDLAQETLLEAWRHLHELRDQERFPQWLSAIARNVCLRWLRKRGQEAAHQSELHLTSEAALEDIEEQFVDDYDIEIELEHKELVELLDRSLALLPAETRIILLERYVRESPLAEVAARLGINASAVAMRLLRGKIALRRVLASEFGQQMDVHDVGTSSKDGWEETSIWCVLCGQRRTMGRFVPEQGELVLRCPTCCHEPGDTLTKNIFPDLLSSVKEYKPALRRLLTWCHSYYRSAIQLGVAPCINCGHTTTLTRILPEDASSWLRHRNGHIFCISCAFCHSTSFSCLEILVLGHPEGRQFWQKHPRIRTLPQHYIEEADGRAAIVTSFQSVTDSARLDVVSACDTYEVICTYGSQL